MSLYYLETNALIGLRNDFRGDGVDWSRCYTSQLAFMELMKGTNEKSYAAKRKILIALQAAAIRIDWEAPIHKFVGSFGLEWEDPENGQNARLLFRSVIESPTIEDCRRVLAKHGEVSLLSVSDFNLGVFSTLQTSVVDAAVRNPSRLPRRQGRAFRKFLSNRLDGVDSSKIKKLADAMTKETALFAIATGLMSTFQMPDSKDVLAEMITRYNGTLDIYLAAANEYFGTKILEKETPVPNDAADLAHFVYLSTPSCRIVSDDKRVLALASSINERKGVKLTEFREKMHV